MRGCDLAPGAPWPSNPVLTSPAPGGTAAAIYHRVGRGYPGVPGPVLGGRPWPVGGGGRSTAPASRSPRRGPAAARGRAAAGRPRVGRRRALAGNGAGAGRRRGHPWAPCRSPRWPPRAPRRLGQRPAEARRATATPGASRHRRHEPRRAGVADVVVPVRPHGVRLRLRNRSDARDARRGPALGATAVLVAWSRLHGGRHFLSDVAAGAPAGSGGRGRGRPGVPGPGDALDGEPHGGRRRRQAPAAIETVGPVRRPDSRRPVAASRAVKTREDTAPRS